MRNSEISRKTSETDINLKLNIDGAGKYNINTGCGFLNHMLELFAKHGRFDLDIDCTGDTEVDFHHTAEDVAIVLGEAFSKALGDMSGINRYADKCLPMDEALVICSVDVSGRGYYQSNFEFPSQKIGEFDTELVDEFFAAFARHAKLTLHFVQLRGNNSHHIAECAFKAFARTISFATSVNPELCGEIPSTKGVLV